MPTVKRKKATGGGLGHVAKAAQRAKERSRSKKWLRIDDGEIATLRILDRGEEFRDAYVHRVPFEREDEKTGKVYTYHSDVPCLDQDEDGTPCPGCRDDLERRYKFWANCIVRDWKEEDDSEPKDTLMILAGGIRLGQALDKKDARCPLDERDIEIEREGVKKNTKYTVEWAEDSERAELSSADRKLAEGKHDLSRYSKPPEFDDFYKSPSERFKGDDSDDDTDRGSESVRRGSAFRREKGSVKQNGDKPKTGLAALQARKKAAASSSKVKAKSSDKPKLTIRRRSS